MQSLNDALHDELGGAARWGTPGGVSRLAGLMAQNAGRNPRYGNGLLAKALGVTIREVQRWQAPEGKQRRSIPKGPAARLNELGRVEAPKAKLNALRKNGGSIYLDAELCDPSGNCRGRKKEVDFDEEDPYLDELAAAMMAGDEEAQDRALTNLFLSAWGIDPNPPNARDRWGIADVVDLRLTPA